MLIRNIMIMMFVEQNCNHLWIVFYYLNTLITSSREPGSSLITSSTPVVVPICGTSTISIQFHHHHLRQNSTDRDNAKRHCVVPCTRLDFGVYAFYLCDFSVVVCVCVRKQCSPRLRAHAHKTPTQTRVRTSALGLWLRIEEGRRAGWQRGVPGGVWWQGAGAHHHHYRTHPDCVCTVL